jgi:hypothetical protein
VGLRALTLLVPAPGDIGPISALRGRFGATLGDPDSFTHRILFAHFVGFAAALYLFRKRRDFRICCGVSVPSLNLTTTLPSSPPPPLVDQGFPQGSGCSPVRLNPSLFQVPDGDKR